MMGEAVKKLATVGNNGQISIGKELAGREVLIEKFPDGHIVISLGIFVLDHNRAFYTAEAQDRVREFDAWEEKNPPTEKPDNDLRGKLKARKRG
jgi:hypothetical protein